ncbi:MAG: radical SAM protein [Spirochaetales bacterium]|nr:radical SAM protein [Spirochaetales bacterium]
MAHTTGKPQALLIFPPVYDFALYDLFLRPYALLKLGRWLERSGYAVTLVNALDYRKIENETGLKTPRRKPDGTGKFLRRVVDKPKVLSSLTRHYARYGVPHHILEQKIRQTHPDIILITSGMTYWYQGLQEVVRLAKKLHPHAPVVAGGIYATLCTCHAKNILEADEIIAGPAYPALCTILKNLNLPVPFAPPEEEYLMHPAYYYDACAIRLNSGCVFDCSYCASRTLGGEFSPGKAEQLARVVKNINTRFSISRFAFYDDALLAQKQKGIIPFLNQMKTLDAKLRFYVPNGLHIAYIDTESAKLMKQAGFREIRLGFESARHAFHSTHGFKHTAEMLGRAVDALKSGGFAPREIAVYVLAGLPGQYPEAVEESIRFAAAFGIQVFVAEYSPIPGTRLWPESVARSSFPIDQEPLTHNNTLFALQWERFTRKDMEDLKMLARTIRHELFKNSPD